MYFINVTLQNIKKIEWKEGRNLKSYQREIRN